MLDCLVLPIGFHWFRDARLRQVGGLRLCADVQPIAPTKRTATTADKTRLPIPNSLSPFVTLFDLDDYLELPRFRTWRRQQVGHHPLPVKTPDSLSPLRDLTCNSRFTEEQIWEVATPEERRELLDILSLNRTAKGREVIATWAEPFGEIALAVQAEASGDQTPGELSEMWWATSIKVRTAVLIRPGHLGSLLVA